MYAVCVCCRTVDTRLSLIWVYKSLFVICQNWIWSLSRIWLMACAVATSSLCPSNAASRSPSYSSSSSSGQQLLASTLGHTHTHTHTYSWLRAQAKMQMHCRNVGQAPERRVLWESLHVLIRLTDCQFSNSMATGFNQAKCRHQFQFVAL